MNSEIWNERIEYTQKKERSHIYKTGYALYNSTHCLTPGLFRSLAPGERKKKKLHIIYRYGAREEKKQLEFKGPDLLGADDLRVLLGLIAMAGVESESLINEVSEDNLEQILLQRINLNKDGREKDLIMIKSSFGSLAYEIGYESMRNINKLQESIERLWAVTVIMQDGRRREGYQILSSYYNEKLHENNGKLCIALNPMLTEAIVYGKKHAHLEMKAIRQLKNDKALLLYVRLCGWIDKGKRGKISKEKLIEYIWPDKTNDNSMYKRFHSMKLALKELESIGWQINEYIKGKYIIIRPNPSSESPTSAIPDG